MMAIAISTHQPASLMPRIRSENACGTPDNARKRVKKTDPIRMMKMLVVLTAVLFSAAASVRRLSRPRDQAISNAVKAPTAPASVGEKMPRKMPPSTEAISTGSGQTSFSADSFSARLNRSST